MGLNILSTILKSNGQLRVFTAVNTVTPLSGKRLFVCLNSIRPPVPRTTSEDNPARGCGPQTGLELLRVCVHQEETGIIKEKMVTQNMGEDKTVS